MPAATAATLITIPFSHYCEKARWSLDFAGVPYREDRHLPMLHWLATFRAGGGRTVPVLVAENGVLADSTDIVRWADRRARACGRRLLPDAAADRAACDALEDELDEAFGPAVRRIGYDLAFAERVLILALGDISGAPAWQRHAFRHALPLARLVMMRALAIDARTVAESRALVSRTLDRIATLLRDGRRHLVGDAFSAADLTFAALAAPLVWPPEHPISLPAEGVTPALDAMRREFRAHAAGAFVLRLYAEHRGPVPT